MLHAAISNYSRRMAPPHPLDLIAEAVCAHLNIEPERLMRRTRKQEVVYARQLTMYFAHQEKYKDEFVASHFKKERTSAIYARQVIANLLFTRHHSTPHDVEAIRTALSGKKVSNYFG